MLLLLSAEDPISEFPVTLVTERTMNAPIRSGTSPPGSMLLSLIVSNDEN